MSVVGASITGMRKDGRPLVTEFPLTAMDMIEYHPPFEGPYPVPQGAIRCTLGGIVVNDTSWMDDDVDRDDEALWIP